VGRVCERQYPVCAGPAAAGGRHRSRRSQRGEEDDRGFGEASLERGVARRIGGVLDRGGRVGHRGRPGRGDGVGDLDRRGPLAGERVGDGLLAGGCGRPFAGQHGSRAHLLLRQRRDAACGTRGRPGCRGGRRSGVCQGGRGDRAADRRDAGILPGPGLRRWPAGLGTRAADQAADLRFRCGPGSGRRRTTNAGRRRTVRRAGHGTPSRSGRSAVPAGGRRSGRVRPQRARWRRVAAGTIAGKPPTSPRRSRVPRTPRRSAAVRARAAGRRRQLDASVRRTSQYRLLRRRVPERPVADALVPRYGPADAQPARPRSGAAGGRWPDVRRGPRRTPRREHLQRGRPLASPAAEHAGGVSPGPFDRRGCHRQQSVPGRRPFVRAHGRPVLEPGREDGQPGGGIRGPGHA